MMYFVIAAMKGEPGRPAGAGWAGCSGGRGGGRAGGGVGAPAPAHVLPGAGRRSQPGPSGPTQRRHLSPAAGSACLRLGAKAHGLEPPSSAPSGSCQLPGSAWHLAGLTKETLRAVAALLEGRGGSGKLGGSRGRPRWVPKARTPDSSGLRREGSAAGPGRAGPCVRADAMSSLGTGQRPRPCALPPWRPSSPALPPAGEVRQVRAASCRSHFRKCPGPSETGC